MQRVAAKFMPCLLTEEQKQTTFKSVKKFWPHKQWWKIFKNTLRLWCRNINPIFTMGLKKSHRSKRARKFGQIRKCCLLFYGCECFVHHEFFTSWPHYQQRNKISARGSEKIKAQFVERKKIYNLNSEDHASWYTLIIESNKMHCFSTLFW
jgi:hypothetical protein